MDVHISLVGRRDLAGEIYRQLRAAILEGRLGAADQLPPSRELATRLSVSRTTVAVAYDRLIGEGFATARRGSGTFVSRQIIPRPIARRRKLNALRPRRHWDQVPLPTLFQREAAFDFRTGFPDAALFPFQTWRSLMARQLRPSAVGRGVYGDPGGLAELRHAIARHIAAARGVNALPDDVVVTDGTQQAVDIIGRVLLAPGDRVAVEDPGYGPPRRLFAALGARVVGVPVDQEGVVVDAVPPDCRLVYVSPSHQFPLGVSMSLRRRMDLLAWAGAHDAAIIEDDYDSEFRFGGRPIEPLQMVDTTGRVIYVGSFSKTMLPTLRLGFMVVPPTLRHAALAAKYLSDWHTGLPTQGALAAFLDGGLFARHVRRMRSIYQGRHEQIVASVTRLMSDQLELVASSVGLHMSALAPGFSVDEIAGVARRAAIAGVELQTLASFATGDRQLAGLVLGYGGIDVDRIDEGLRRLRTCFLRRRVIAGQ